MSQCISNLTDHTFNAYLEQQSGLVLVDFWAAWCSPCKRLSPILDELAAEYQDEICFIKINADDNPTTAQNYNIRSLPNMILFKDGKEIDRVLGIVSKSRLAARLDQYLEA